MATTNPIFTPWVFMAQQCQAATGVPASVTLAQGDLESSMGRYCPRGSNNWFGIKKHGQWSGVDAMTTEVIKGKPARVMQTFCMYPTVLDGFIDHAMILLHSDYAAAMAAWRKGDLVGGIKLMAPHYATDTAYATKIIGIINANDLAKFDALVPGVDYSVKPATPATVAKAPTVAKGQTMTTNQNTGAAVQSTHLKAAMTGQAQASKEGMGEMILDFIEGGVKKLEAAASSLVGEAANVQNATTVATEAVGSVGAVEGAIRELTTLASDIKSGAWLQAGGDVAQLVVAVISILGKFGISYGPLNILSELLMKTFAPAAA